MIKGTSLSKNMPNRDGKVGYRIIKKTKRFEPWIFDNKQYCNKLLHSPRSFKENNVFSANIIAHISIKY